MQEFVPEEGEMIAVSQYRKNFGSRSKITDSLTYVEPPFLFYVRKVIVLFICVLIVDWKKEFMLRSKVVLFLK